MYITASHLYAYTQCPHRIWRDAHDDPKIKDPVNEFVQMLWEKGTQYEKKVIDTHKGSMDMLDLSGIAKQDRFKPTIEAMKKQTPYIYQGRLEVDELVGEPDLLELQENGEYLAVDIKSGMGLEGEDDENEGKPKKHYALQLALYTDALNRLGHATHHRGKIWDSKGNIVDYDLNAPQGVKNKQTWWELYQETAPIVRALIEGTMKSEPAMISICKLCQWQSTCKKQCIDNKDISLVPELGRAKKEAMLSIALDVVKLSAVDIDSICDAKGKTGVPGIGKPSLEKYVRRAKLLTSGTKEPLIRAPFSLPEKPIELYFDLEADPTQDIVYLHGVVERKDGSRKFHSFVAEEVSADAERDAWARFWEYIHSHNREDIAVYYYSKYERTQYRNLNKKYPDVITEEEVEAFFDPAFAVDLYYDIVLPCTDWPTYNYSVKTLAQLLGFSWRDSHPSGAASIEWYNEWCKDRSPQKLQRILDYNEDDCIAMIYLKDKLASCCSPMTVVGSATIPVAPKPLEPLSEA